MNAGDVVFFVTILAGAAIVVIVTVTVLDAVWHMCLGVATLLGLRSPRPSQQHPVPNLVPLPAEVRARVMARDGFACVICGATEDLTVDHKLARHLGGSNDETNLQTLCRHHNSEKGTRLYN